MSNWRIWIKVQSHHIHIFFCSFIYFFPVYKSTFTESRQFIKTNVFCNTTIRNQIDFLIYNTDMMIPPSILSISYLIFFLDYQLFSKLHPQFCIRNLIFGDHPGGFPPEHIIPIHELSMKLIISHFVSKYYFCLNQSVSRVLIRSAAFFSISVCHDSEFSLSIKMYPVSINSPNSFASHPS